MSGYSFLVAMALVGCTMSAVLHFERPKKSGCCMPDKYSVALYDMNTVNSDAITQLYLQFDFTSGQEVMQNFTMDTATGKMTYKNKMLIDFNEKMMYYVLASSPEDCYKHPYDIPAVKCIPDNATYLGSTYLGPMGAGGLPYDGWRFKLSDKYNIVSTIAISKDSCVPLMEGVGFPDKPEVNQLYMFSNFEKTITQPSAFNLPKSCYTPTDV